VLTSIKVVTKARKRACQRKAIKLCLESVTSTFKDDEGWDALNSQFNGDFLVLVYVYLCESGIAFKYFLGFIKARFL